MKHIHYTLLCMVAGALSLTACHKETHIKVTNGIGFERCGELVRADVDLTGSHILVDEQGREVNYQTVPGGIVFQANVPACGSSVYTWKEGQPSDFAPLTTAFFLGDRRKDDFAWENDKAAYRMYGPALLPENPSSGVDLWLKHSSQLTADAMYRQEESGKPYHIDYGLGIDSYKVGHAAGCGGVAIVSGGQIWPGGPFSRYEILQEGPLETIFRLDYDSVQVGDKVLRESITITVSAGAQVNKAEVTFSGDIADDMQVGGGIFLHDGAGQLNKGTYKDITYLTYGEPATSDQGIYKIHEAQGIDASTLDFGRNFISVILPGTNEVGLYSDTKVLLKPYKAGDTFTYYFGGGWSKRDYTTDGEWENATQNTVLALDMPLKVTIE